LAGLKLYKAKATKVDFVGFVFGYTGASDGTNMLFKKTDNFCFILVLGG
jgi:hypothetical protein